MHRECIGAPGLSQNRDVRFKGFLVKRYTDALQRGSEPAGQIVESGLRRRRHPNQISKPSIGFKLEVKWRKPHLFQDPLDSVHLIGIALAQKGQCQMQMRRRGETPSDALTLQIGLSPGNGLGLHF